MNKRKFIKSLGALAVGCMMATSLTWKPIKVSAKKAIVNPEYASAKYEIEFLTASGFRVEELYPVRSNNPNMIRDKDFIHPFIEIDA